MKKMQLSWKKCRVLFMVICMLAAGICYSCAGSGDDSVEIGLESREGESSEGAPPPEGQTGADARATDPEAGRQESPAQESGAQESTAKAPGEQESTALSTVFVHVCGCVEKPGVYELPEGSRIYEAIEAAGGLTEEGAGDFLNLALPTEDGMKVEVPDRELARLLREQGISPEGTALGRGQTAGSDPLGGQAPGGPKVNLNTAGREELMTLDGIGETRAEAIIRYRETYGGFQSIEDVMNVSGIKEGAFEKIKDDITV